MSQVLVIVTGAVATFNLNDAAIFWSFTVLSYFFFVFVVRAVLLALLSSAINAGALLRARRAADVAEAAGFEGEPAAGGEVRMSILSLLGPLAFCFWVSFPVVWALTMANLLGVREEMVVSAVLDVASKVVIGLFWMLEDSSRIDLVVEAQLRSIERQRAVADASNVAKRKFMRYIFHELRVPLNALSLGLDETHAVIADVQSVMYAPPQPLQGAPQTFAQIRSQHAAAADLLHRIDAARGSPKARSSANSAHPVAATHEAT